MKSDIPDKVAETLKDIGMTPKEAGWNCHGTYVLLHKALEKVAVPSVLLECLNTHLPPNFTSRSVD